MSLESSCDNVSVSNTNTIGESYEYRRDKKRKSVRTYKEEAIAEDIMDQVRSYLIQDKGLFDVPVDFILLDAEKNHVSSPVILGAHTYVAGKYKKQNNAELSFGYAFEKFILYATSLGLGTVWLAATIDRKSFEQAIDLKADEVMPVVTPLGYAAEKRSVREKLMRKGMKSDSRLPFESLFYKDTFDTPLRDEDENIWHFPLEMVRWAPSATNKQPWRVVVEKDQVHFYEKKTKGYEKDSYGDIQKVDVGIALCHFEIAAKEKGLKGSFVQSDPGIKTAEDTEYMATYVVEV